jgi:GR25 family glycosyltransferase involved in LPS biosynthesis
MRIFVINLDRAKDRWEHYKDLGEDKERFTRWSATDYNDLPDNHPIFKDMVSYWNIDPDEHKAKCACYLSHTNVYRYIIQNHLYDTLVLEDDAELVGDLPDNLPQDGFTYLGGFTSNLKLTDGPMKVEFEEGINKIKHNEYRMLCCLAIYIPNPRVALKMLQACEKMKGRRPRAVDTMLRDAFTSQYVYYPAPVIERKCESNIRRGSRNKYCNQFYEWKK